ncbi:putative replication factor-A protein 1 [Backusella circina FSU 941]|nr:putative replication factor-A protein 1 [Backusella circina FSU 941]
MAQVTAGSIKALYNGEKDTPLVNSPLVQIINIKSIPATSGTRYRAIISDGVHFMQAMLASHHAGIVEDGSLKRLSVIRLNESVCNELQNRKILIILNMEIVNADVDAKIGNPSTLENSTTNSSATPTASPSPAAPKPAEAARINSEPLFTTNASSSNGFGRPSSGNMQMDAALTPIKNLNPYQNKWTIKARVSMKTPIKTWHNQRSDGKLFSVNFLDQSGEIKATGFNDHVDRFYNLLEEGKIYYISKARVSMAKKQFSNLTNEYELMFENGTEIEVCPSQEAAIPQMNYDFVKIADIDKHEKLAIIDVMGVITEDQGVSEIVSKATGKPTTKRDVILADDSKKQIRLTLWDAQAQDFDASGFPVLAIKGARVGDWGGRTLSSTANSMIKKNPDLPIAHQLRQWYSQHSQDTTFESFSNMSLGGGMGGDGNNISTATRKVTLQQAKSDQLGSSFEKPDYFMFRGTVAFIKSEGCAYPACPECRKKVAMEHSGWRCEKCQKTYEAPQWKYVMTANIEDATSQTFVNFFDETGNAVMNMTAAEFINLKENDNAAAQEVVNKALYKTYNFKVRAKTETFNDLARVKYHVLEANPIDYCKESEEMVTEIEGLLI